MNDYTLKKIEEYSGQNFTEVKDVLSFLNILGHQKFFEIAKFNFWYLIDGIVAEMDNKNDRVYWFAEDAVIKMLDLGNLRLAYNLLKDITLSPTIRTEDVVPNDQESSDELMDKFFKDFDVLGLSDDGREIVNNDLEVHPEKYFVIRKKLDNLIPVLEQLVFEINAVGAFLNLINERKIYSIEKMIDIIVGTDDDYDVLSAIFTLRQDFGHKDGREIAFYFATDNFDNITEGRYDWYNAVLMVILSNLIYFNLHLLGDNLQAKILRENFYKATLLGVPVRSSLEKILYDTNNFSSYVVTNKLFVDALRDNAEKINLENKTIILKDIFAQYYKEYNDSLSINDMEKYLNIVLVDNVKKHIKITVLECLNIFALSQESKLIEHNSSQDLPISEIVFNQTEQLLLLFANRANWFKMVEFLQEKDGNYVSAQSFLRGFVGTADLNDESVMSKFVEFGNFLKKQNLMPSDKEVVEYHESDSKFYWSDWVTSL